MSLPIRTLPIVEHWDCQGCATCCRGTIFALSEADLTRLREQEWDKHPDFRGVKILRRHGLFKKTYSLAKRKDGTCVFLGADGLCRIHGEFGFDAKPLVCRMAPLQLVPLDKFAFLTVRRYCPSGAADEGRELGEHLGEYRKMAEEKVPPLQAVAQPAITRRCRRGWKDTHRVLDAIERLMIDDRFPLVRRLVHGLEFCDYLDQCRLHRLDGKQFAELVPVLEEASVEGAAEMFADRARPRRATGSIFRQVGLEYLRLHPGFVIEASLAERWRLVRAAVSFSRGKGQVPYMHGCFPATTFATLEQPLGHLGEGALRPINAYFETAAASKQYAVLNKPGWAVTEGFRAMALSYPVAMWLLRLACGERTPQAKDAIDIVGALDRGQAYAGLSGYRHRQRVSSLGKNRQLGRLIAWYAR